jgi:hypothetical protein
MATSGIGHGQQHQSFWSSGAGRAVATIGAGVCLAAIGGAVARFRFHKGLGTSGKIAAATGLTAAGIAFVCGCASAKIPNAAINGTLGGDGKSFDVTGTRDAGQGWKLLLGRSMGMNISMVGTGTDANPGQITAQDRYTHSFAQLNPGPTIAGEQDSVITGNYYYDETEGSGNDTYTVQKSKAMSGNVKLTGTDAKWDASVDVPHQWDVHWSGGEDAKGWHVHVSRPGFDYSATGTGPMTRQQGVAIALGIETDTADLTANF